MIIIFIIFIMAIFILFAASLCRINPRDPKEDEYQINYLKQWQETKRKKK